MAAEGAELQGRVMLTIGFVLAIGIIGAVFHMGGKLTDMIGSELGGGARLTGLLQPAPGEAAGSEKIVRVQPSAAMQADGASAIRRHDGPRAASPPKAAPAPAARSVRDDRTALPTTRPIDFSDEVLRPSL